MEINNSFRYIKTQEVIIEDDNPHEKVKCSICMNILIDPIQCLNCEQSVCRKCISNTFRKKCPTCSKTEFTNVSDDVRFTLEKLQLKCPYRCNKIIPYKDYFSHSTKCENKEVKCKNIDCDFKCKRKNMFEHIKTCKHRYLTCKYCDSQIKQFEFFIHESSCEMKKNILKINTNSNEYLVSSKTCFYEKEITEHNKNLILNDSSQTNTVSGVDFRHDNSNQNNLGLFPEGDMILTQSTTSKCQKCEKNKYKLTNRCFNCLKLICARCNPSVCEDLPFCKKLLDGCGFILELPKIYYKRPNVFCPIFKKFNYKEKLKTEILKCLFLFLFLGWLEIILFVLDLFVIVILCVISVIAISLFSLIYIFYYILMFLFKRRKKCKTECMRFSYKDLLENYLLRVCKNGTILGNIEGECWATSENFKLQNRSVNKGKILNEFQNLKDIFESVRFVQDCDIFLNNEKHSLIEYDDDGILFLVRNGGGTLVTQTHSKFLIGYFCSSDFIPRTQNFQNFYDTKNKLIQLRNILHKLNL